MEKFCSGWSVEARRVILSQPYGDWRVERVNYWSSVPELMQAPYRAFSSKNQGPKVICSRNFDLAKNRPPPTLFSHVSSLCHHHRSPKKYQVQNNGNGGRSCPPVWPSCVNWGGWDALILSRIQLATLACHSPPILQQLHTQLVRLNLYQGQRGLSATSPSFITTFGHISWGGCFSLFSEHCRSISNKP